MNPPTLAARPAREKEPQSEWEMSAPPPAAVVVAARTMLGTLECRRPLLLPSLFLMVGVQGGLSTNLAESRRNVDVLSIRLCH